MFARQLFDVALFYGLLFQTRPLPWDSPLESGSVQLRPGPGGVEVILGEKSLGHMTERYADGIEAGSVLLLPSGVELRLFNSQRQAAAWQSWGKRQGERWEHGLNNLLLP